MSCPFCKNLCLRLLGQELEQQELVQREVPQQQMKPSLWAGEA
jgi:pyruvate-formate lyase-activating enzyme